MCQALGCHLKLPHFKLPYTTIFLIFIRQTKHTRSTFYLPSSSLTASAASRGSSNSTKAKPGGFLATHTLRSGP